MKHAPRSFAALALVGVVLSMAGTGTALGTTYYVDNTATGSANGLSWANAFTHLSQLYAAATGPDDIIYISGGPAGSSQTYGGYLRLSHNGTSGHPITITRGTDSSHNGVVIFDGADGAESFSYCDMVGRQFVTINGGNDGIKGFAFVNLYDTGDRTAANKIFADSSYGLTVQNCGFTNVNNGIRVQSAQYVRVSNCSFDSIRGDAAIRGPSLGPDAFDANIIENNTFRLAFCTNCPALVYGPDAIQASHGTTVRYNFFTIVPVNYYTSTQHPDYCQVIGNHNKFYGNYFLNPGDSCIDLDCYANSTPHDWWIYDNIFQVATNCISTHAGLSPNPWFFRTYSSAGPITSYTNIKLWNNLFLDNSGWNSINFTWAGTPTLTGMEIKNNIFQNSAPYYISGSNPNYSPTAMGMATNIYATGGSWLIQGSTYTTNNWGAQESSAIFSSPTFVAYAASCATNDMHLGSSDTIATGKGVNLSAYFTTDYDAAARTVPWDIGPYASTGTFFPPSTPSNLSPSSGATGVSLLPTLTGSSYADPNTPPSSQTDAQFQVYASDGTTLIWDSGTSLGAVTSKTVTVALPYGATCNWQCRYKNASLWSAYSAQTTFTTLPVPAPALNVSTSVNVGKITYP